MTGGVVPGCDRETDLVVELGRRRYVAFLLDVESHAGRTDQDAATIRTDLPGDNWGVVIRLCDNSIARSLWLVFGGYQAASVPLAEEKDLACLSNI